MRTLGSVIALALTATAAWGQNATLGSPQGVETSAPQSLPAREAVPRAVVAPVSAVLAEKPNILPQATVAPAPRGWADDFFKCSDATCLTCPDSASCLDVPARWTVRHDVGDGVGYLHGFTYVEGFVPIQQEQERSVFFGDLRVVNFDDDDRWEFNKGLGYRAYNEGLDAVLGVNLFWDGRHTDAHFFHQIGIGGEAIFGWWEARCNGYIIVGPHQKLAAQTFAATQVGNQLILDRFQTHDVAMGGLDVEVGGLLPVLPKLAPHAFVGYYHYGADGMPSADGVRGRLEAWLTPQVSLHFSVQNDRVFDTTISGGLAWHFGGGREQRECGPRSIQERLGQRVVRDVDIVITQKFDFRRTQTAIDGPNSPPPLVDATSGTSSPPTGGSGEPTCPPKSCPPKKDPPKSCPPKKDPPKSCPPKKEPPSCCLPFPGAPGDPDTFPGHHYPPGFHHWCFPGRGRYKHEDCAWEHHCWLPRISACSH